MNINYINKRIEDIHKIIPEFNTEERKEIKKNNKLIEELILELSNYKNEIYSELKEKSKKLMYEEEYIDNNEELIKELLKKINYLKEKSFYCKLRLDINIYNIKYSNNLEEINKNILDIINKFKLININLNSNDFKYSPSVYTYMDTYLKNIDNTDFDKILKETFDKLYWECPEIIDHIVINLLNLINKQKNNFEGYIKKQNINLEYDNILSQYYELKKNQDMKIYNKYNIFNDFITGKININDYLNDSPNMKEIISKFVDYNEYCNYEEEEKKYFYEDIKKIYYTINEYISLNKFNYLFEKVKEIYIDKEKYSNNLNSMNKNIDNLEKQRNKMAKRIFMLKNRINSRNEKIFNKKYNILVNKLNNKINEIIEIYKDYDNTVFINDVITKIDETTTYYDVLKIFDNNYSYLINYMKENKKEDYQSYQEFLYEPYLVISKNLIFNNNIDIKEKLIDKYDLINFSFNLDDNNLMEFKNNLEYLIRLSYIEENNMNLEDIKLIININNIKNEKE